MTAEQGDEVEHTLWSALRALEEQASLRRRMLQHAQKIGRLVTAREFEKQAKAAEDRAGAMRLLLLTPERANEARREETTANASRRNSRVKPRTTAR